MYLHVDVLFPIGWSMGGGVHHREIGPFRGGGLRCSWDRPGGPGDPGGPVGDPATPGVFVQPLIQKTEDHPTDQVPGEWGPGGCSATSFKKG